MGIVVNVLFSRGVFRTGEENVAFGTGFIGSGEEKGSIIFLYIKEEPVVLLHLYQEGISKPGICLKLGRQREE